MIIEGFASRRQCKALYSGVQVAKLNAQLHMCCCCCRVGLDVLMHAGVFDCHTSLWQDKYASELRAASALFEAGYSIDCLLVRCVPSGHTQSVNRRDVSSWS
jgi:hypothetical protein